MDRGIASLALFLCLVSSSLWTLSCARNLFDSSAIIDVIDHPNPDDANSLLEKTQDLIEEPSPFIQFQPGQPETEPTKPETVVAEDESNEETTPSKESPNPNNNNDDAPFTVLRISSMDDPRIPRRPLPLGLRMRHRCRHNNNNNNEYKAWTPRLPRHSNYMTMSKPELDQEFDKVARNWVRQVPAELLRVRHIEPMLLSREVEQERERERKINMALDRSELWRKIYLRRHHKQPNEEEQQQNENNNNNKTPLMKRIRKFLSHF